MIIKCVYDKLLPISELKSRFHPENPNEHPPEQIERIKKILKFQGVREPARISNQTGVLCVGHGRILAAEELGWAEYPVSFQDYDDVEQEYCDLVADNALQQWSTLNRSKINTDIGDLGPFDIEMLGFENFTVEPIEKLEPQCDEDEVPEVEESFVKLGDIWQLGNHRLMCEDSTSIDAVEKLMNGEKADMVFTDPPYGLGDKWSGGTWASNPIYDNAKKWDQPLDQTDIDWIITLAPIVIIWGANYYKMPPSRCWLSWSKAQKMETMADFELAWTNFDKVAKSWTGARNADGKRSHPTQKPVSLMEWAIGLYSNPKNVLDLFGGSGSTVIACEKSNRKCFMMELDPHYCGVIIERWQKYTGKQAMRIEN